MSILEDRKRLAESMSFLNDAALSPEEEFAARFKDSKFGRMLEQDKRGGFRGKVIMPQWLLRNVIPSNSIGTVYGPGNSGKSHLVIDLVTAMLCKAPTWQDFDLDHGSVVYFAEDLGHIEARFLGYNALHGGAAFDDAAARHPLYCHQAPAMDESEIDLFAEYIRRLQKKPKLIVFDTWSATFSLENGENDAKGVQGIYNRLEHEILPLMDKGVIIVVDHTSKASEGTSIRGSSVKTNSASWTLMVKYDETLQRSIGKLVKDRWGKHEGKAQFAGQLELVDVEWLSPGADPDDPFAPTEMDSVACLAWEPWSDEMSQAQHEVNKQQRSADKVKAQRDWIFEELRAMHVGRKKVYLRYGKNPKNLEELPELRLGDIPGASKIDMKEMRDWIISPDNPQIQSHILFNANESECGIVITAINDSPF